MNGSKAVSKTRLATMDAAEAKRKWKEVTQEDGKRGRALAKGAEDSDNPTQPADLVGERERAPAKGVKDSDILTQYSDWTRGGGNEDALGSGNGEREQAPVKEVKVSGDPSAFLDEDAAHTSETLAGQRERAPVEGVADSDIPTQSIDKKSRLEDPHLAFAMDTEVMKEHAQW